MKFKSVVLYLFLILGVVGCQSQVEKPAQNERQAIVAERGGEVMPFDLERTTHIFEKLDNGGRQQVISDDEDVAQIDLIRTHLVEETQQFSEGNFHDPAMIHGDNMAGLHELMTGYNKISIEYTEIEQGGQILYTTDDPKLVSAIHSWFEAQVSDHGQHAQEGQ